ncbi:hypothetical protein C6P46_000745 [Rhodotorula mucilaginosa]|uniref:E3 ubiquitin-protein ligase listerin n=1 Tax=Rhodotorula mucilaginosa TaxID=5537 RepID=A0A9P6VUY6_RHOMI|nr:hypothetical protein C6P46_000745 [Rhodotorula mucilaginosa]
MAPKGKSSASSATRKKQAAKAAKKAARDADGDEVDVDQLAAAAVDAGSFQPKQRGQKKVKKDRFAPKVKKYVPPPPPPKGLPDPVDVFLVGRGKQPDPQLVVILRRLVKKDEATLLKGCEALEEWVRESLRQEDEQEGEDWEREMRQEGVVDCMDVWVHALHKLLTASGGPSLLASTRSALLAPMWLEKSDYVGAWCTAAHDNDRGVRRDARASWDAVVSIATNARAEEDSTEEEGINLVEHADSIASFAFSVILGNGANVGGADTPLGDAPTPAAAQNEDPAFLRTSAISTLAYLVQTLPPPLALSPETIETLTGEDLWDLLTRSTEPGSREQPGMVRKALYDLLGAIVARKDQELLLGDSAAEPDADESDRLRVVASRVLANCWEDEEGWPSIILFLRILAGDDDNDEDKDSVDEDEHDDIFKPLPTVALLLRHLTLGCSSHPTSLYPTILLILATLPASQVPPTRPALALLFESFWAAYSSRAIAIGGARAVQAWAAALLEAVLYETSRVEEIDLAAGIAREWLGERLFALVLGRGEDGKCPSGARSLAAGFEKPLARLEGREDSTTFDACWDAIVSEATAAVTAAASLAPEFQAALPPLAAALQSFAASANETLRGKGRQLALEFLRLATTGVAQAGQGLRCDELLAFILEVAGSVDDAESQSVLDDLARDHLPALISDSPTALQLFVSRLAIPSPSRDALWRDLFEPVPTPRVLLQLIDGVSETGLAADLPSAGLDDYVLTLARKVVGAEADYTKDELELVRRVILQPQPLVSPSVSGNLVSLAAEAMSETVRPRLHRSDGHSTTSTPSLERLIAATALVAHYVQLGENARTACGVPGLALSLFDIGYSLPIFGDADLPGEAIAAAQQAWSAVVATAGQAAVEPVFDELRKRVTDASSTLSSIQVVATATDLLESHPASRFSLQNVLPSREALDAISCSLSPPFPAPSLAIIDPLIPATESSAAPSDSSVDFDRSFLSSYARALVAVLEVSARDHTVLRRQASWILPHLLLLADVARDELSKPSPAGSMSSVFAPDVPTEILERVSAAADGAVSYLLSTLANAIPEGWHPGAVSHLRSKETVAPPPEDALLGALDSMWRIARGSDVGALYAQRGVRTVLSAVLRYAEDGGAGDAERWLALAQTLSSSAPNLACAVLHAIKSLLLETPRFERYQNELAADLAGVTPSNLDVKGPPALRQLLASAPPPDAPVIFLPQQRSMFLIQAITRWIASDEPIPDEMSAGLVELFCHLAPIVQDLSGGHWDLMFDLIETYLDAADWEEATTLPAVHHSCLLLAQIRDLSTANAELRDTAKARVDSLLEAVLRLFVSRPVSRSRDEPRVVVVETMARLIKTLPQKLLSMDASFEQLLRLLQDPAFAVQLSSYQLLRRVIDKHVSDLVVEAELDVEDKLEIRLPPALVTALEHVPDVDEPSQVTTYLLSWLLTFSFFESASPRLREAYLEQLRDSGLVVQAFLPAVFAPLQLSDRTRPVDLTPWSVDDFVLEQLDARDRTSVSVFAAHVYYRALHTVPSVIRAYWSSLQNLQLSRVMQSFTTRHFSPLLVADELSVLRDADSPTGKQLRDNDDFTVKVASNGSEVKVVFVVDEEAMEIAIKVPNEFPLAGVEVRDVRKVGVTDKQWRAWLLAMQQVITSQSAAIADAILLFKRNVTLHFEGVESCAICYSTVSTVDRSLPTKTCKTCSNKFHAGCLYKWFTTSHGSTCPLCRQVF